MTMLSARPSVTVITVCYNSTGVLPGLIASLPQGTPLVLVNNSQADAGAVAALASDFIAVRQQDRNLGFGVACNAGAAGVETDYLLFLNPDARLGPGALDALMQAAAAHPGASAFNPVLLGPGGNLMNKRRSVLLPRDARLSAAQFTRDGEVPVLHGAALLVRRDAFERVGGFDPAIFLYHEDDDLALRLRAHGPLRIVAGARVVHEGGGGSGDRVAAAGIKAYNMGRSRVYAMRKHGRPFAFLRSLGLALLQLLSPSAWVSRRKRVKQTQFLRGILSSGADS